MRARKVLLIGWDAADWKVIRPLMDAGRMPNVRRLVETGATGQLATLHPPLSPMLWTSIATGKRPFKHGIHGFSEPTADGRGVQPVTNLSRTTKAIWNILNQNGLRSIVIGWWPSHPAEPLDGVMVSDHFHRANRPLEEGWPLPPHAVHPTELAQTLADLRLHPDRITPELIAPFIPRAREIDQDKDRRLAVCMHTIAECLSIERAALWLLTHQPWDFFAVYFDSIDHFSHGFMRYHPPRQSWVTPRDFELYNNVVVAGYELHDRILGELLAKSGEDTTAILVSDHGFHPDHLRPSSIPDIPAGPAVEHRDLGILAISGPGIRKGHLLYGSSVLDVTPTILTLYGLPSGEDMDGKVLAQAFEEPPEVTTIPSWDRVPGPDGRHPAHLRIDPVAANAALEQMIALGYIQRPDENRQLAVSKTIRELRYNLAEAYQDAGRHQEACAIFDELYGTCPDDQRFAVRLFVSCQALGLDGEMRRIAAELDSRSPRPPVADYLTAHVLIAEKDYAGALAALERLTESHLVRPSLFLEAADLYLRLHRPDDARQVYAKALDLDPDHAPAHLGLCRMALRQRKFEEAAEAALQALATGYHLPLAHYSLGRALSGLKQYEGAAQAFRAAISLNSNFARAYIQMAQLLQDHLGDPEAAREHRAMARRMRTAPPIAPDPLPSVGAETPLPLAMVDMPPLEESLVVVTGLPRSGTSMLMQMLAAGGKPILADGLRQADEDNPRGYLEFHPVKSLLKNNRFLRTARGKAVKVVAPLLSALPDDLPCLVILLERDFDEILDSQDRMLKRNGQPVSAARRRMLKDEYARIIDRAKTMLARRPQTQILALRHRDAIADPRATAANVNQFLGGSLDAEAMAAAIDPALYRNREAPPAAAG